MNLEKRFRVDGSAAFQLKDYDTGDTAGLGDKSEADKSVAESIEQLRLMQDKLYAQNRHAVLILFQAMDAAGKDSTISHVMSGVNPQGCEVHSFKSPSAEELSHDYLWRISKCLPERGRIGIFNRSYYEEVLVTRVHPELILAERLPGVHTVEDIDKQFWRKRYKDIADFERYLTGNGFTILKFFLHLSKEEQKKRFLDRIEQKEKNWKFSTADIKERALWDDYQAAYETAIARTATTKNPWYVIPADHKWFSRYAVSQIIDERLAALDLQYPTVTDTQAAELQTIRSQLEKE